MRRVLAFALVLWLGNTSASFAGETLLESASRLTREAARTQVPLPTTAAAAVAPLRSPLALALQGQPGLASSGMSKRKKALIWLATGVGFAAVAYGIDHNVRDVTPSTLGTRKD